MRHPRVIIAAATLLLLCSCNTPKNFNYLQDLTNGMEIGVAQDGTIRLRPKDQISVLVKSKDPAMSALFNKGLSNNMKAGQTDGNVYTTGYILAPDGSIDFPVLGKIPLSGLTRYEAEQSIQAKLRAEQLKDANVTVEFMNLTYTISGQVNNPGVFHITKDELTLLEAIGQAGDLNVYGKRDSVIVVRHHGDTRKSYVVSLNSARDLLSSEAFFIQQNDVIYVKANDTRARQSTATGNETRSISLWISLVSVLTTLGVLIFK